MPPKRNGMSATAIEKLIAQRIANALLTYEANQNSRNGIGNRNGNGNDNGNGSHNLGVGSGKPLHTARGYEMSWKDLMKMMTEAYCLRNEIQKLETELWNLTVKGIDVGLLDSIQGNVTSSKPTRLQEAIQIANSLMDQKNVARAYTAGPSEKKEYAGTLPLCNKRKLHCNRPCIIKCTNCKKVSHMAQDCRSPTAAVDQRTFTFFECRNQGHYRSECPRLKNQNYRNQTKNGEARGRVYALGSREADQDPNVITNYSDA
ncbi:retrovirus-related pol polyprotein from transposon TNT 1-94 [Tanacetum coccineum]|uniref:Retrovirus-related pol polyprotein from transposon TNT 1-94 n=1 Tax=Tanacetum coccineum TaxID=301880 RepID=A0ABQ5CMZ4_9ASTR